MGAGGPGEALHAAALRAYDQIIGMDLAGRHIKTNRDRTVGTGSGMAPPACTRLKQPPGRRSRADRSG
jgi:hypothetical protein